MLFDSFFLAGFECATGYNRNREPIDQICATQHDRFVDEDYTLLRKVGIRAARDGVRWNLVDRRGHYDFSTVDPLLAASRKHGIAVIYDLFHYGYPDDVDLLSHDLFDRFSDYCYAAARYISRRTEGIPYFTPVNEPSYYSWAGGQAGLFAPHLTGRGWDLKVALVRAAIQGIDAIRAACPAARIVNVDPLCRVVAPRDRPDLIPAANDFNSNVAFQSLDILCGRKLPELGGSREHLDIVGINYYWTNQWELTHVGTPLRPDDPRCLPLSELVRGVWERYGGDVLITETSHVDEMRPVWLRELTHEAEALLDARVPLGGICLYPILGMPEWHAQQEWTRLGLWDLAKQGAAMGRVIYDPMLKALREGQQRLERQNGWSMKVKEPERASTGGV